MKSKTKWATRFYYWFLKRSKIWRRWYEAYLTELLYDLELYEPNDPFDIEKKYKDKLNKFKNNRNF